MRDFIDSPWETSPSEEYLGVGWRKVGVAGGQEGVGTGIGV